MQSQHNRIEKNDDDIELPLAHIRKMQNTAQVGTLASDGTSSSTKGAVGRKRVDVGIKRLIYTTGLHQTDWHLCKKSHN